MPVRRRNGGWQVDIRHRGKRLRMRCPGTTRAEAQAYETYLRGELAKRGDPRHVGAAVPTLADFAKAWMQDYVMENKPSERRGKELILRVALVPAFGASRLDRIGTHEVQRFKREQLERGLSPKTVNNRLTVLRRLLRSAQEWGLVDTVPLITPLRVPPPSFRFLAVDEVRRLAERAHSPLVRAMIVCAAHTGLRLGELCGLSWPDIDFERRQLCVRRSLVDGVLDTPKNNRTRYVPMTNDVVRELGALPRNGEGVFLFRDHRIIDVSAAKWLHRACQNAGIDRIGWHVLRHTFASELVSRGVPLAVVRDLLGHSTIKMTERYAHLAPGIGHEAVRALSLTLEPLELGHYLVTASQPRTPTARSNAPDFPSFSAQPTQNRALTDAA